MAKYNAYALVSLTAAVSGRPTRVYFVRKDEDGGGFDDEKLRELRIDLAAKYEYDLVPVDLSVVGADELVAHVKKALPKRKRT